MILRLSLNEMDLQRSKQMLALLQRQPNHLRRIFGHGRATADLMDANDPIRSDQLQHDPLLHPELPVPTYGPPDTTPMFWTVSVRVSGHTENKSTTSPRKSARNVRLPVRAADDGNDGNHLLDGTAPPRVGVAERAVNWMYPFWSAGLK